MNILVIDDSSTIRSYIVSILKKQNWIVDEAASGKECLTKIESFKPDLIILDLLMPDMDGFEVLEQLKNNGIKIPVIVQSADVQEDAKKECFDLGISAFINKPFRPQELINTIESLNL